MTREVRQPHNAMCSARPAYCSGSNIRNAARSARALIPTPALCLHYPPSSVLNDLRRVLSERSPFARPQAGQLANGCPRSSRALVTVNGLVYCVPSLFRTREVKMGATRSSQVIVRRAGSVSKKSLIIPRPCSRRRSPPVGRRSRERFSGVSRPPLCSPLAKRGRNAAAPFWKRH